MKELCLEKCERILDYTQYYMPSIEKLFLSCVCDFLAKKGILTGLVDFIVYI